VGEHKELRMFLVEAVRILQSLEDQILRLSTADTAQTYVMIDKMICFLHTLKRQALFFGFMEMAMLIRQAVFMLQAIVYESISVHGENIDLLLDIKNTLKAMVRELCGIRENIRVGERVEFH